MSYPSQAWWSIHDLVGESAAPLNPSLLVGMAQSPAHLRPIFLDNTHTKQLTISIKSRYKTVSARSRHCHAWQKSAGWTEFERCYPDVFPPTPKSN